MMCKAFGKKLFGVRLERLKKNIIICFILFFGLRTAEIHIEIGTFVLFLMSGALTAGLMWQALSSEDNMENMSNLLMMPFEGWKYNVAYIGSMGLYTIITKTGMLLAVIFAVTSIKVADVLGCILCILNGIIMAACIYTWKRYRGMGVLWAGAYLVFSYLCNSMIICFPIMLANFVIGVIGLVKADAYSFYQSGRGRIKVNGYYRYSIWRYLFRYMLTHKNYLLNTVAMWGVACVLPLFMGRLEKAMVLPIGFAILTLNTPICILLSCDASLERAVNFLPGQKRMFFVPYLLFIFACNLMADIVFMVSWGLQIGGIDAKIILTALFFALQSAIFSVLLECRMPLRNWKIESDLWHHPRKYIVPAVMVLCAGVFGIVEETVYVAYFVLAAELVVFVNKVWE